MYGWIVDGISSLFEPVAGQKSTEGSGEQGLPGAGVKGSGRRQEQSHSRAVKRSYQSLHGAAVRHTDPVEAKRRRRDGVLSLVKRTVTGLAGLLRLQKQLPTRRDHARELETTQPVPLMGIDELQTWWLSRTDWRMDKPAAGVSDRSGKNHFQSALPPLMRKYSGAVLPAGLPGPGKDRERRGSLQLLPSRPAVRGAAARSEPACSVFGPSRCCKPTLTVEQAIKQDNKEHYRRLLEMVTERYSRSQPLPFSQTRPHNGSLSQAASRSTASETDSAPVSRRGGCTAAPAVRTHPSTPATNHRWVGMTVSAPFRGSLEGPAAARCAKARAAELDLSTEMATRLHLADREASGLSRAEAQPAWRTHSRLVDEDAPRLTEEMAAEVSAALAQSDPSLVLSAAFKLRITHRDLATLQEGGWLNDEVMNFYFSLIMERSSTGAGPLKVYSFSTFFFPKLRGAAGQAGGHAAVKRWTKAVDLFLFDLILVPLHLGSHWAVAAIDLKSKAVRSYDSMGRRHDDVCGLLLNYLKEEHRARKGRELDGTKWSIRSWTASEIPQQKNGSDCGVFACKYAECIARGKPLTFQQSHMPRFRRLMMWEILNQKLL